jgi:hypothetical protein
MVPKKAWIALMTLNMGLFFLSAYFGAIENMCLNLFSAAACYLAMRLNAMV